MNPLPLSNSTRSPVPLTETDSLRQTSQIQKEQFARDFESVFIEKLLEEMQKTIGEWGLEQDSTAPQIQGLFQMHLARDAAAKGGIGLWKEIVQSLENMDSRKGDIKEMDNRL
ncbi:MAG: hypothetical protein KBI46_00255 [Phycisphaerae bacterium]|nr:hypothetical protein [Phycisphaerae bacterium]